MSATEKINGGFVHLRVHSAYSLSEGAIKIDKLASLCEKYQMPAVAVTDTNNLFGAMDFSTNCAARGIQPIIACQLNVQHPKKIDRPTSVLLYAKNTDGYQNLIQLVSNAHLNPTSASYPEISLDLLAKHSSDIILATGGIYGSLGALLLENDPNTAQEYLAFLLKYFSGRLYIELSRHNSEQEQKIEEIAVNLAYDHNIPLVATNNVCFASPEYFNAHDILLCIALGKTIYDAERQVSSQDFYFKSPQEMTEIFYDLPEAIENTIGIAHRCSFCLTKKKPWMPQFTPLSGKTQDEELRDLSTAGLGEKLKNFSPAENFDEIRKKYFDRLYYELDMIKKMGFSGYFLIIADYVQWAKSHDIPVGPGRGSGAGSIVAWAVKITDVDPIRFQLLFERFLNPDRVSMPDVDIDFCQERRDEVIAYVQQKYGYQSVAQIITFGKLQARAVVKDVGRVLAIPYGFMDKISKMIPFNPANPLTLQQAIDAESVLQELLETDPQVKNLMEIALKLEGLYRHASVHAAGVVISDKNIQEMVPLYKDQKSIMPVTQFSMKYVESAGLIKFDFLGLKTLTVIQKNLAILKKRGIYLTTQEIPLDDPKTFELLRKVNCVGVFQIESAGMRDVLRKLQPDRIGDIIALVALYRPGPMDDIPKYIACKHGVEKITYLHEKLEPILAETYGVMVYQEQVMQIAQEVGGYTMGQADILRRAMGKKDKDEMHAQKKRFIDGATERGVSMDIAERLFEQMNKFAGYGFNKCHSTPYGLLTYQTAYLKANYTMEFFAAVMTLDMTNTDKLYAAYQDAKKNNITITPPDINLSENDFLVDYENNLIRYSLAAIKSSSDHSVQEIVQERTENGNYTSIFDFMERMLPKKVITKRILEHFIKSGVFDSLHPNRNQLFSSMEDILAMKLSTDQVSLFEKSYPPLANVPEWDETTKLQNEFVAVGFYISSHPMQQYEDLLKSLQFPTIMEALNLAKTKIVVTINSVIYKTTKNQSKFCILQVSDMSGSTDVTLFSETLENYRELLEIGNIVVLTINCYKNDDKIRVTVEKIKKFDANDKFTPYSLDRRTPKMFESIVRVKINALPQLSAIKTLADNFRTGGNTIIELIMPNEKKIVLPDKYLLQTYDILDLKNIVGISNVMAESE
ncbi:MAG: DNA polymerase III subunit alpha [Holosporaceae bacterium]|jgi:DNA polymerase-3 subunit alpha|nr:DNA polymerase III subunit alpha [Holosporaceae bacterium]